MSAFCSVCGQDRDGGRNDETGNGLDFTPALDKRSARVQVEDLLRKRAIKTLLSRSGHDNRKIEEFAEFGMSYHILTVGVAVPVTNQLMQTDLKIDNKEHLTGQCQSDTSVMVLGSSHGIVFVETLPWDGCDVLAISHLPARGGASLPSPRTALNRPMANRATLVPNFIFKVVRGTAVDVESWREAEVVGLMFLFLQTMSALYTSLSSLSRSIKISKQNTSA
jgi:hypothetical protein